MKARIVAVGKLRPAYRNLCDEYLRRLGRYLEVMELEVREARGPDAVARREEGRRLLEKVPPGTRLVALDRGGSAWTSEELARQLSGWREAAGDLTLVLGGSTGLDPAVLGRARVRWSLGPLTLPHELARLVVCEQLYRAVSILRGERYHK